MPRLYYPKESFRGGDGESHDFSERLVKLIPTEVITCFTGLMSLSELHPTLGHYVFRIFAYLSMLFFIPLYYWYLNRPHKKPIRNHTIVSCLAFVIWSYSIAGSKVLGPDYFDTGMSVVVLLLFTAFSPFVPYNK